MSQRSRINIFGNWGLGNKLVQILDFFVGPQRTQQQLLRRAHDRPTDQGMCLGDLLGHFLDRPAHATAPMSPCGEIGRVEVLRGRLIDLIPKPTKQILGRRQRARSHQKISVAGFAKLQLFCFGVDILKKFHIELECSDFVKNFTTHPPEPILFKSGRILSTEQYLNTNGRF